MIASPVYQEGKKKEFIFHQEETAPSVMTHNAFCGFGFGNRYLSISARHYLGLK